MYTHTFLDEADVKVVYDQQGNKREVLLSYEKYKMLVAYVEHYTQAHPQEFQELRESATSQAGWDIFNALGRDAQPGTLPDAASNHDAYLYGKADGKAI